MDFAILQLPPRFSLVVYHGRVWGGVSRRQDEGIPRCEYLTFGYELGVLLTGPPRVYAASLGYQVNQGAIERLIDSAIV